LLALSNERFNDAATLREARTLLRACLARHLGDRPLESRRLMQAVRAAPSVTAANE
jgi:recombinational DNA repair protein (RecF pathway)